MTNFITQFFKATPGAKIDFNFLSSLIVDQNFEGIAITDSEGMIVHINPAWEKLTGWSAEEVVGKTTPRIVKSGKQNKAFYDNLWATIKRGEIFKMEIVNKRKDGTLYDVDEIIIPLKDTSGKIIAFAGLQRDITERKLAENKLKVQAEKLEAIAKTQDDTHKAMLNILEDEKALEEELKKEKANVEQKVVERTAQLEEEKAKLNSSIQSLTFGFIIVDSDYQIITINNVAKMILCSEDLNAASGIIKPSSFSEKECDLPFIENRLKGVLDFKSNIQKCLTQAKRLDFPNLVYMGRFFHISFNPIAVNEDKLKIIGCVITIADVTEERLLDRARDEFFSIASHELRTPLTAIKGNTSMILDYFADQIKDPQMKEMIDDVHESSIRLIEIVNDFLDTSRLELGKMQFKKDVLNLSELIPSVIKEYQVTSSRKKLYIHFEDITKVPPVLGDKDRFKQVLINLIGNGLKFTTEGGVTISLKTEGNFVKVLVSDTGMGISEDNQKLLFKKFQQAESNILTRDVTKGTGLGLYISRMMVEGMRGRIALEKSVVGKGSTFSFALPVATQADIAAAKAASAKIPADFHAGPAMNIDKSNIDTDKVKN